MESVDVQHELSEGTVEKVSGDNGPTWPPLSVDHPLLLFLDNLEPLLVEADYDEVYGISLKSATGFQRKIVLQKFLRASQNDVKKAKAQLSSTLKWRKSFQPLKCIAETHSKARFEGLGFVTQVRKVPESPNAQDVVTFNIYGAVTNPSLTFGDKDGFLRWRIGLMELSLQLLDLQGATIPIPDYGRGPDPHQAIQIHDYLNVSFIRQNPDAKAAANLTIETMRDFYPETLSRKFFVNVPRVMGWVFSAMKLIIPKETAKKFTVLTWGKDLAGELGPNIPTEYGGDGNYMAEVSKTLQLGEA